RERHGISLAELARRANLAKSTLSQLEAGVGNPSIETVWALALALDVPFSRLVDPEEAPVQVIRAGEGNVMRSDHAPFAAVLLSACPLAAGPWRAGPVGAEVELGPGDYARFPGDRPHSYEALEPGSSAVLVMEHR